MEENILNCIVFDQDCFCDMKMIVADKRQRIWKNEYLPELSEKSRCETLYSRKGIPESVSRNVAISCHNEDILRRLWMSNLVILGSAHDGLYLEKGFPILKSEEHSLINETDLDILFEYSGLEIKKELTAKCSAIETFLVPEETKFKGYFKLRILSPALTGNSTPVYLSGKALKQRLLFHLEESNFYVSKNEYEVIEESPALGGAIEDELGVHYLDYVVAITTDEWPQVAKSFITREKESGWPGPDIIMDIVSKGCRFVATAHNSCKSDSYQWRMSFAVAEQILARSLNNSQIRTFLFFKTLFKAHLSDPECLSSYMMKNVLFWAIEMLPRNIWLSDNIFNCLESLVDMLCIYLYRHEIPNFFLQSQNLIGHIEKPLVSELAKKAHQIQKDVLAMVIKCTEVSFFHGICEVSLKLMHINLLKETANKSSFLISMAFFSTYLYLRLQALRYTFQLLPNTMAECFTKGCLSVCAVIPPRAVWYCSKALQIGPMIESIRFYKRNDTWELDISCLREQVVQFWRSPVYKGIFKIVLTDRERITKEHIDSIPEFDHFVEWVDRTCLRSGGQGIKQENSECLIAVD